jgi:hypothetical protein
MPRRIHVLAALAAALQVLSLSSSEAFAGTYDVYSCRLPDGTGIPASGWRAFGATARSNQCTSTGGLTAGFADKPIFAAADDPTFSVMSGGWFFEAPGGTSIAGFEVQRAAFVLSGPRTVFSGTPSVANYYSTVDRWPPPAGVIPHGERCVRAADDTTCESLGSAAWQPDPDDVYRRSGLHGTRLYLGSVCSGSGPCGPPRPGGPETTVIVHAARFTLRDQLPPRFSQEVVISDGHVAPIRARFAIADEGAGISDWKVFLDGRPVASQSGQDLQASCREPFIDTVPCPSTRDLSLAIETKTLKDGEHQLHAFAIDAAGNASWSEDIVFSTRGGALERPRQIAEPTPATSVNEAPLVNVPNFSVSGTPLLGARLNVWFGGRSRATTRTLRFGEATMVEGRLIGASSTPIAGAELRVQERGIGTVRRLRQALVRTDAGGRFSFRVAPGPSRVIQVSYGAADSSPVPVATSRLIVRVRAGVTLRTSRAGVRNGTALRFSGRVRGDRGTRRALVTIYALGGGPRKRIPVATVRAGSSGRFSHVHRFSRILGPSVYRFEARIPRQTGFPYLEGASRVVTVRGRP